MLIGALVVAIPLAIHEALDDISEDMSFVRIAILAVASLAVATIYLNQRRFHGRIRGHVAGLAARVGVACVIAGLAAAAALTIFDRVSWRSQPTLAIKRVVIVGLLAVVSAVVSDMVHKKAEHRRG